jgi:hypothetical protein
MRTLSADARFRMGAANRGKKFSADTIAKMSAASKGRKISPETAAKISAIQKAKNALIIAKTCKICGIEKSKGEFYYGRMTCKKCVSAERKTPEAREQQKQRRNSPNGKEYQKRYMPAYLKKYQAEHKDDMKKYGKEYGKKNREKINARGRDKWKNNIHFRLIHSQRTRIGRVMKLAMAGKKARSTRDLIGCTPEQLKVYIESMFKNGMTWDNYGKGDGKWSIDHVIPCDLWELSKEEEQKKCFHYTNLQPMWYLENCGKRNRLPGD